MTYVPEFPFERALAGVMDVLYGLSPAAASQKPKHVTPTGRYMVTNVLAGRGMRCVPPPGTIRRRLQLALVSSLDGDGRGFGAKVSTFAGPQNSGIVFFGDWQEGTCAHFPLNVADGAPPYVTHEGFLPTAKLRVQVLAQECSGSPSCLSDDSVFIEGYTEIDLANILSSSTSYGSNWMPLEGSRDSDQAQSGTAPEAYVQVFVMPDHGAIKHQLQTFLADEKATLQEELRKSEKALLNDMASSMTVEQRTACSSWTPEQQRSVLQQHRLASSHADASPSTDVLTEDVPAPSAALDAVRSSATPVPPKTVSVDLLDIGNDLPCDTSPKENLARNLFEAVGSPSEERTDALMTDDLDTLGFAVFEQPQVLASAPMPNLSALYAESQSPLGPVNTRPFVPLFEVASPDTNSKVASLSDKGEPMEALEGKALAGLQSSLRF
mmetsp:Transcript_40846/g.108270  ORF Transcript_40846/g.108270 Transcript_40846/m.108270 type:complete len:438 (-) Transcript_40846:86-1399(-)